MRRGVSVLSDARIYNDEETRVWVLGGRRREGDCLSQLAVVVSRMVRDLRPWLVPVVWWVVVAYGGRQGPGWSVYVVG